MKGSATIVAVTEPSDAQWDGVNSIINDPSKGNSNTSTGPVKDATGQTDSDQCWTFNQDLVKNTNTLVFSVNLKNKYFIHAVLLVQSEGQSESFGNYKVYIGDNSDYLKNTGC